MIHMRKTHKSSPVLLIFPTSGRNRRKETRLSEKPNTAKNKECDMFLYNSLSKHVDAFEPLKPPAVSLYTCGPTVYYYPHIGHGRKYVMDNALKGTLPLSGYEVKPIQNVPNAGPFV